MDPPRDIVSRPSWDEYFMRIADVVRTRSPDTIKVGAVLVSQNDRRIISSGYNGVRPGLNDAAIDWSDREFVSNVVVHAEANAILYSQSKFEDAVLYCTLSPCVRCLKLISATKIRKVVYGKEHRDFDEATRLCEFFGIELCKFQPANP